MRRAPTSDSAGSRLARRFPRATRAARRAIDLFPLTPLGVVSTVVAAAAVLGVGLPRTDLVILVIGGAVLGAVALSLALVSIAAAALWLWLRRRAAAIEAQSPLRLECGFPSRTGFSLPALNALPLIQIAWSWTSPEASVEIEERHGRRIEIARPSRRIRDAAIERRFEITDAFHLTKIAFRARQDRSVRALPSVGALRKLSVAKSASSGGDLPSPFEKPEGEPVDMRRYTPGDPMRFILWKTFAKSRQVVVRSPEQAISPTRKTAAYVIAGDGDEAAAGAARAAVESGSLGATWALGADGAEKIAKTAEEALDVLALSGRAPKEGGGSGLAAFLAKHAADASTRVIIFAPPSPGPWLDRAVKAARARGPQRGRGGQSVKNFDIFVCIDGLLRKPRARLISRLLFLADAKDEPGSLKSAGTSPPPSAAATVVRTLAAAGASVTLADRRAGRTYDGSAQRAFLALSGQEKGA